MATHTAKSLFDANITNADSCIVLYDGVEGLHTPLDLASLLRAAIVFSVSALDAYYHDKIKYRVGRYKINQLPSKLREFPIQLDDINSWTKYTSRPSNFIRNVVTRYYAVRPLQKQQDIENALALVEIKSLWSTIEPNNVAREQMTAHLWNLMKRRNQIAHEGDRLQSRKQGKRLRPIDRNYVIGEIAFVKDLVSRIESAFPN
jgi:hypothetical protein